MTDVVKKMFPESDELKKTEDGYTLQIVDAELDPVECQLFNDNSVHIDTEGYTQIVLTESNLETLLSAIKEVKNLES